MGAPFCHVVKQTFVYFVNSAGSMIQEPGAECRDPLSKEVPLKTFLLDHSNCQLILSSVYIKTITVFPK